MAAGQRSQQPGAGHSHRHRRGAAGTAKLPAAIVPPFQEGRSRSSLFRHVLDGLVLLHGLFPVGAIELLDDHTPHGALIEAMWGDS